MRSTIVIILCVLSATIGAAVDHYWETLPSFGALWESAPSLARSDAPQPEQKAEKHPEVVSSDAAVVEVLGDRVRCDVRYQELKIPESEYKSFFDKCMGGTGTAEQSN
jgi:hypothetical protein